MKIYIESITKTYNILFNKKINIQNIVLPSTFENIYSATGYKIAYLTNIDNILFKGLVHGSYYINDKAICIKKTCNFLSCNCGFYAFKDKKRALVELSKHYGTVMIEVELYSDIVIHQFGYRGREQDIIRMFLPYKCSKFLCSNPSSGLYLKNNRYQTICSEHKNTFINIKDLSSSFGLDIIVLPSKL